MNENVIVILFLMLLAAVVAVVRWIVGNLCVKVDDTIHNSRVEKNRKKTNENSSDNLADKYK